MVGREGMGAVRWRARKGIQSTCQQTTEAFMNSEQKQGLTMGGWDGLGWGENSGETLVVMTSSSRD